MQLDWRKLFDHLLMEESLGDGGSVKHTVSGSISEKHNNNS